MGNITFRGLFWSILSFEIGQGFAKKKKTHYFEWYGLYPIERILSNRTEFGFGPNQFRLQVDHILLEPLTSTAKTIYFSNINKKMFCDYAFFFLTIKMKLIVTYYVNIFFMKMGQELSPIGLKFIGPSINPDAITHLIFEYCTRGH